jgi:hypothetical protein
MLMFKQVRGHTYSKRGHNTSVDVNSEATASYPETSNCPDATVDLHEERQGHFFSSCSSPPFKGCTRTLYRT